MTGLDRGYASAKHMPTAVDTACPSIVYVDPTGARRSVELAGRGLVTLGRRPEADVSLPWDPEISRLHAEVLKRAGEWVIVDDGLSQNGTFVNGIAVDGRRRLADGDLITLGRTNLTFCDPRDPGNDVTLSLSELAPVRTYSEQQQQVLRALCAPLVGDGEGVRPAGDVAVAAAVGLPVAVVGRELDAVALSFGYGDLSSEERRLRTALTAIRSGLVAPGDD
jgi:pSer/pThr/pTyr-binding forkhead associated (FHA) protein